MAAMTRIPTCAGPDSVAIDQERGRVVVSCALQASIEIVPLARRDWEKTERIDFAPMPDGSIARGRAIFFHSGDARIAADGRACASCHVEGGSDGLVWSTPNGMRNTKSLAGRGSSGPFGWKGESATLEAHIARTIRVNLGGRGLPKRDLDDLAAYVASIPAPPAAKMPAEHGRELFVQRDCVLCHDGARSDGERHDVGGGKFLTPSLAGVAHSGPYFHDGRYASLETLLDKTSGKMGSGDPLGPEDRDALAAYLRTL